MCLLEGSIAALCIAHRISAFDVTEDMSEQKTMSQLVVDFSMTMQSLQPVYQGKLSLAGLCDRERCTAEQLQTTNVLLKCGIREPLFNTLQHFIECMRV